MTNTCKSLTCARVPALFPGYCEDCITSRKTYNTKRAAKRKAKRAEDKVLQQNAPKKRLVTVPNAASSTIANNDDAIDTYSNVSSSNNDDEPQFISTALVETKQDNPALQAQQLQEQQLLFQVAQVQDQFNKVYPMVIDVTTKFNEISRAAQMTAPTFHGQIQDGSDQDVLLSDHYRNSEHTPARHVFDVCQDLSRLLKQLPIKRVKSQEYLKFEVCKQLQDIVAKCDELALPMRSRVPPDFLRPVDFIPVRAMTDYPS